MPVRTMAYLTPEARSSGRNVLMIIDYTSIDIIAYIKNIYLNYSLIGLVVVELFYLKVGRFLNVCKLRKCAPDFYSFT
jgi:hypothetical protein